MSQEAQEDCWVTGYWTDGSVSDHCEDRFPSDFCRLLRQYRHLTRKQAPIQTVGRVDPRANLLLAAAANVTCADALSRLTIGQARLSWRLADAWQWLTPTLGDVAVCAGHEAYFGLQRDHESFMFLPLYERPRPRPQTRTQLLREAAVIRYLRSGRR